MLHAKQTVYYTISYIHLMNDFLPDCKNVHNDEDWKKTIIVCTRGYQKVLSLRHFPHSDSTMLHT